MITKSILRYTDSNSYKDIIITEEPIKYIVSDEDVYNIGRITFIFGLPFNSWPIILRYNNIIDPIDEINPGMILYIPTLKELKKLELSQ